MSQKPEHSTWVISELHLEFSGVIDNNCLSETVVFFLTEGSDQKIPLENAYYRTKDEKGRLTIDTVFDLKVSNKMTLANGSESLLFSYFMTNETSAVIQVQAVGYIDSHAEGTLKLSGSIKNPNDHTPDDFGRMLSTAKVVKYVLGVQHTNYNRRNYNKPKTK